ncbi:MAG: hypothetical protein C0402_03625 [Thermodesulfovibrio sp.]|nr:hypothetical protein [Thermodesulfovibrio sp.]
MKLGEALVRDSLITRDQLKEALERQVIFGGRIGTNIVERGFLKEAELAGFLSRYFKVPAVDVKLLTSIENEVIDCISRDIAEKYRVIPFKKERKRLHVAMMEPNVLQSIDELRFRTTYDIVPYIITEMRLLYALEKYYGIERNLRYISTTHLSDEEQATAPDNKADLLKLKESFASARDKEEIVGLLLHAAGKVYSRVAMFVIKSGSVSGWKAKGLNVERAEFRPQPNSLFAEVIAGKNYYRGPLLKVPANEPLITIVGGTPQDCLVVPVQIREKIIGLLYVDNGIASVLDANLGYINNIVSMASISFEITILRRKIFDL